MRYYSSVREITNTELQDIYFREQMKNQERTTIRAYLATVKLDIQQARSDLENVLESEKQQYVRYASTDYVNNIKQGFEGSAANAAETTLKNMKAPMLYNSVKVGYGGMM